MGLQKSKFTPENFPEGAQLQEQVSGRQRRAGIWATLFLVATMLAIIALGALLYNIIDGSFGYVAVQNKVEPSKLVADVAKQHGLTDPQLQLQDLPKELLIQILQDNISKGLMRRFESEQPFVERSQENVYQLVLERVVERTVVRSWKLTTSLFQRQAIAAEAAQLPNSELIFRSWVSPQFITGAQSPDPQQAGIRTAILGSLWVIAITLIFALPVGVGAAIYLEEYAVDNWLNRLIQTNINNLAGVPSIIYGMLGLAIFVRLFEALTSGSLFGLVDETTANGRTILSASLTLALLVLPIIIINAQEAIRAVPRSLREAGFGLGATKWQVIWAHVLPTALPGILTGNILAMSRAIGETAPLVVVGASTFIAVDPSSPFAKFTTLPVQIYQWTARPQDEFRNIAAAAILVLLVLLLSLNAAAILLRNRYSTVL